MLDILEVQALEEIEMAIRTGCLVEMPQVEIRLGGQEMMMMADIQDLQIGLNILVVEMLELVEVTMAHQEVTVAHQEIVHTGMDLVDDDHEEDLQGDPQVPHHHHQHHRLVRQHIGPEDTGDGNRQSRWIPQRSIMGRMVPWLFPGLQLWNDGSH